MRQPRTEHPHNAHFKKKAWRKLLLQAQSRRHVLNQFYQTRSRISFSQHGYHHRVILDHPSFDRRPQAEVEVRLIPQRRAEVDALGRMERQNAPGMDSTGEVGIFCWRIRISSDLLSCLANGGLGCTSMRIEWITPLTKWKKLYKLGWKTRTARQLNKQYCMTSSSQS